jgi:hypothetical protein
MCKEKHCPELEEAYTLFHNYCFYFLLLFRCALVWVLSGHTYKPIFTLELPDRKTLYYVRSFTHDLMCKRS